MELNEIPRHLTRRYQPGKSMNDTNITNRLKNWKQDTNTCTAYLLKYSSSEGVHHANELRASVHSSV